MHMYHMASCQSEFMSMYVPDVRSSQWHGTMQTYPWLYHAGCLRSIWMTLSNRTFFLSFSTLGSFRIAQQLSLIAAKSQQSRLFAAIVNFATSACNIAGFPSSVVSCVLCAIARRLGNTKRLTLNRVTTVASRYAPSCGDVHGVALMPASQTRMHAQSIASIHNSEVGTSRRLQARHKLRFGCGAC